MNKSVKWVVLKDTGEAPNWLFLEGTEGILVVFVSHLELSF